MVCETTGLAGSRETWWPANAGEVDWLREGARMTQAARDVSRVFLDDVASVVSGTASLELGSVTSRTPPGPNRCLSCSPAIWVASRWT